MWTGSLATGGYGRTYGVGRLVAVHRAVYEALRGPIPEGYQIDHVKARGCTSRACCNIDHLEAVTQYENIMRSSNHVAFNARRTHCKSGHLLAGDNLLPDSRGRYCRECNRLYKRMWRARQKAKKAA